MRVYHLLSAKYAIENLKKQRLKVSLFADLNDPFELLSVELSELANRKKFQELKKDINGKKGVLCFSRNWNNPVLWSHYGDKHKGICLGFDTPDTLLKKVIYKGERLPSDVEKELNEGNLNGRVEEKLLITKFEHWQYEEEERVILPLDKAYKEKELYFVNFCDNLKIKEVIVGARCKINKAELEKSIETSLSAVLSTKARLAFKTFEVTKDRRGFR